MPFNGSGTFTRVYNWVNDANNSINITASRVDTEDSGFATGLSNCLCKDGQQVWGANQNAGTFKITNLANGSGAADSATVGQTLQVSNNLSDVGTLATARTNIGLGVAGAFGYLEIPLSGGAAYTINYTAVAGDSAKQIQMNGASLTATIPANASVAYLVGTVLTFVNINSSALSIAITTDTLTKANSTTTGTRTLAQNGIATALKIATTSWLISGTGLT